MAASIMGDASKSMGRQEEHLIFERIRAERPAMAEHHGLAATPVLVIDLRAVFGRDRTHVALSSGERGEIGSTD